MSKETKIAAAMTFVFVVAVSFILGSVFGPTAQLIWIPCAFVVGAAVGNYRGRKDFG